MINELCTLFDNLSKNNLIAEDGFEYRKIRYTISIDSGGNFLDLYDNKNYETKVVKEFLCPQVQRTANIFANLLVDNSEYVTNFSVKKINKKKHNAFIDKLEDLYTFSKNPLVKSILDFYEKDGLKKLYAHSLWEEVTLSKVNEYFNFEIDNNDVVTSLSLVINEYFKHVKASLPTNSGICSVYGKNMSLTRLAPTIKGIVGSQGNALVSFNCPSFESYGFSQGENANISEQATEAYTKALNWLLRFDSKNKLSIGSDTIIYWCEDDSSLNDLMQDTFSNFSYTDFDNDISDIESTLKSIWKSKYNCDNDNKYYVAFLTPNSKRLFIRYFICSTVKDIGNNILKHFTDIYINGYTDSSFGLYDILSACSYNGKISNSPKNLGSEMLTSILYNSMYPETLQSAILNRIKAENSSITNIRMGLLKGFLNRKNIFNANWRNIKMSLDEDNNNVFYLLGRLFAIYESVQKKAYPNINANLADKYFDSASSFPKQIFGTLEGLTVNYNRLLGAGLSEFFKNKKSVIFNKISEIPSHGGPDDKSIFCLGYYHEKNNSIKQAQLKNNKKLGEDI